MGRNSKMILGLFYVLMVVQKISTQNCQNWDYMCNGTNNFCTSTDNSDLFRINYGEGTGCNPISTFLSSEDRCGSGNYLTGRDWCFDHVGEASKNRAGYYSDPYDRYMFWAGSYLTYNSYNCYSSMGMFECLPCGDGTGGTMSCSITSGRNLNEKDDNKENTVLNNQTEEQRVAAEARYQRYLKNEEEIKKKQVLRNLQYGNQLTGCCNTCYQYYNNPGDFCYLP